MPSSLRLFGIDPVDLLAWGGLDLMSLNNPDCTISLRAIGDLAQSAVDKIGCTHCGLKLGRQNQI
jgi:hypothetical protein